MVNYPLGIDIKEKKKLTQYGNRGMSLEQEINESNRYYLNKEIAVIYKKDTPIKIVKMNEETKQISSAFFSKHSTTDYNGVFKGKYIDFEAKTTNNKTAFPLANFHSYQLEHLKRITKLGGIGFVLFEFKTLNLYFVVFYKELDYFLTNNKRKSIPLSFFKEKGKQIKRGIEPPLDYLKIIEKKL
ncbi:MAG: Holliday junction resolvase RecU [Erysipelotrichaceae bacterium]|jgi:recombination protein U|nr:Holliday junction resolvase RecU [Erysipelotrichaceae bacterium]MCB9499965.1 Holliday junction resolvase RecU [Erysipelotrichaceae bacterium]